MEDAPGVETLLKADELQTDSNPEEMPIAQETVFKSEPEQPAAVLVAEHVPNEVYQPMFSAQIVSHIIFVLGRVYYERRATC